MFKTKGNTVLFFTNVSKFRTNGHVSPQNSFCWTGAEPIHKLTEEYSVINKIMIGLRVFFNALETFVLLFRNTRDLELDNNNRTAILLTFLRLGQKI